MRYKSVKSRNRRDSNNADEKQIKIPKKFQLTEKYIFITFLCTIHLLYKHIYITHFFIQKKIFGLSHTEYNNINIISYLCSQRLPDKWELPMQPPNPNCTIHRIFDFSKKPKYFQLMVTCFAN